MIEPRAPTPTIFTNAMIPNNNRFPATNTDQRNLMLGIEPYMPTTPGLQHMETNHKV
jgi:hypothetical protein